MSFSFEKTFDVRRRTEPARNYLWRVEMPDLITTPTTPFKSSAMDTAEANKGELTPFDMNEFNSRISEVTTPYWTIDSDKVIDGASFWYTARHNDISNVGIVIDEMPDGSTHQYFDEWKSLMVNDDGTYNPPAFWKRDISVYRLNLMKFDFEILTYVGYFPTAFNDVSSNYDSEGVLQYSLSFTGDSLLRHRIDLSSKFGDTEKAIAKMLTSSSERDPDDRTASAAQLLNLGISIAKDFAK